MSEAWQPHGYQKRAMRFLLEQGAAGLLLDPGLGKTSISLGAFKVLKKAGLARRALIIAPLRPVYLVWPKELKKWAEFEGLKLNLMHGEDKRLDKSADIHVINPEGLRWLFSQRGFSDLFKNQVLIVDESTRFKHTTTERFRLLKPFLPLFARRWILTGTPAPNGLLDLFGQVFIMDLGHALGPAITFYRMEHFSPGYGGHWVLNQGHDKKIYKKLRGLCLRMSATDYLKMPPLVKDTEGGREPIYVDLPPKARQTYDEMEVRLFTRLDKGEIVAANTAVAMMKCRQIANGGLYYDDLPDHQRRRQWQLIHSEKLDATLDLVEQLQGQPVLINYDFDHDLQRLQQALKGHLGFVPPHIGRGVVGKKLEAIEEMWNLGRTPVLLVNSASASLGINLQAGGRAVIWHSLTWNYEDYDQLIRRIWRQGQKQRVFVYHVIARGTVDQVILGALRGKARTQEALFKALTVYRAGRRAAVISAPSRGRRAA